MRRPLGITITALLAAAIIVYDVTLSMTAPGIANTAVSPSGPTSLMIYFHLLLAAFVLVQIASIPFYWLGKNWARWIVLIGCIRDLYGVRNIAHDWHRRHDIAMLTGGSAALALYLLWYLHTDRVREWFSQPGKG